MGGFFGGGGASVDLASPPAIGNSTPNSGVFTTLQGNTSIKIGGADAASISSKTFSMQSVAAGTSNTAGADLIFEGSRSTGSANGGRIIFRLSQAGSSGSSQNGMWWADSFLIRAPDTSQNQRIDIGNGNFIFAGAQNIGMGGNNRVTATFAENATFPGIYLWSDRVLGWSASGAQASTANSGDLFLRRDAANTLAQYNGTNAQTFRLYNTFTSATNFERVNFRWASNEFILDAENGSAGGTLRGVKIGSATTSLLGFYGATPVDQPATVADPTGGGTQDAEARTAINAIIDRLQELGLVAT